MRPDGGAPGAAMTPEPSDPAPAADGAKPPRKPMDDDPEKVRSFLKDRVQRDVRANTARMSRNRADLYNLLLYRGGEDNHWSVWDASAQTYVPRPQGGDDEGALPEWFFRATTNLFGVKTDGICSILNQAEPSQEVAPEQDTDEDRATADIAEAALPVLYDECGYSDLRPQIHKLIALTNCAAVHVYYDTDERHGMDDMPLLQCQNPACMQYHMPHDVPIDGPDADTCPECGQPGVVEAMHPQTNLPMTMPMARGKICMRALSSFEVSVPRSAQILDEQRVSWVSSHGRMDPTEVLNLWPKAKGHVDAQTVTAAGRDSSLQSVAYADQMRALSSPGGGKEKVTAGGSNVSPSGPVIWMVWADPVDDDDYYFPDGLYAVILEDEVVLESGPLPLKDDRGRPVKNVLLRTYQATPGSAWGKPPGDDMATLQRQLNLAQALVFLILMHDSAPTTFIPDTVTLLEELSGVPGSTVPYKATRPGDKPTVVPGQGFPAGLEWFIEYIVSQFDVVSKLNAVLQGQRPEGDPTAHEIEILRERGMAAFQEPLAALVAFEKRLSQTLLWTARQSMWSPRFYSVAGDNGEWEVKQFLGADLQGHVSIQVEPSSAWPASVILQNLRLDKAIQRGIINPQDPEVQDTYLTQNDLADYKHSLNEDRKQIAREIATWKTLQDPAQVQQPDPLWNLPQHLYRKVTWLKTETAEAVKQQNNAVYMAIRQQIQAIQTLMQPPAPAGPPVAHGAGPTGPTGDAVSHAVASAALHPKRPMGSPTGHVLAAARAAGAIHPAGHAAAGGAPLPVAPAAPAAQPGAVQ